MGKKQKMSTKASLINSPVWVKESEWCFCKGQGSRKFVIMSIKPDSVLLAHQANESFNHGWTPITELHR